MIGSTIYYKNGWKKNVCTATAKKKKKNLSISKLWKGKTGPACGIHPVRGY